MRNVMKLKVSFVGIIFFIVLVLINCAKQDDFPVLKGPYLGQKPPGMTPEIFVPGVLNNDKTGAFCTIFSPEGDEFYFTYYQKSEEEIPGGIAWMRMVAGVWAKPEILPFDSPTYENDVCMSYDGSKLIFRSWRPLPDGQTPKDHSYLWFAERTKKGWESVLPLLCGGMPVRTGYPSISQDDTLYFAHSRNKITGIYRSRLVNGVYQTPEHVYTVLEDRVTEGDMYVASDESYMIIACYNHPENTGGNLNDLYIVFRKDHGLWTKPIKFGSRINTRYGENCPQVSPDGKYFFFHRYDPKTKTGNIYWVDVKIIEDLKPEELK